MAPNTHKTRVVVTSPADRTNEQNASSETHKFQGASTAHPPKHRPSTWAFPAPRGGSGVKFLFRQSVIQAAAPDDDDRRAATFPSALAYHRSGRGRRRAAKERQANSGLAMLGTRPSRKRAGRWRAGLGRR